MSHAGKGMDYPGDCGPRLESDRRYCTYRLYAATVIVMWNVLSFHLLFRPPEWVPWMFVMVPLMIPAIIMVSNPLAFRWSWSVFGPYERSCFPPR